MTERERDRNAARRLAIIRHAQEVTGNVSKTCRYYGITRQAYYKWLRRYEDQGLEGLRDRSSRPHASPNATKAEVVGKIVYLRQSYHFGPHKIAMYLKRYHDVQISPSGIWRILRRLDMSRLPASQRYRRHTDRWKRYEKPLPGHRVQIDVNRGVGHVYIKPATPRLNGKVERSHRIDQEEFYRMLEGVVIDDTELFNDRLQE